MEKVYMNFNEPLGTTTDVMSHWVEHFMHLECVIFQDEGSALEIQCKDGEKYRVHARFGGDGMSGVIEFEEP